MKFTYLQSKKKIKKISHYSKKHGGDNKSIQNTENQNSKSIENNEMMCKKVYESFQNGIYDKQFSNCIYKYKPIIKNQNFINVDFSDADLSHINFENVFFLNCKFVNNYLSNTIFNNCVFHNISSKGISYLDATKRHREPKITKQHELYVLGKTEVDCQIVGPYINFSQYYPLNRDFFLHNDKVNFTGCDFSGVDFSMYTWNSRYTDNLIFDKVNFNGANFTNIYFVVNSLKSVISGNIIGMPSYISPGYTIKKGYILGFDVNLTNADLSGISLNNINLSNSKLNGIISGNISGNPHLPHKYTLHNGYILGPDVNLSGANLTDFDLDNIDLRNCNLKGLITQNLKGNPILSPEYRIIKGYILGPNVNLTDANISDSDLTDLDLSNCILKGVISGKIIGAPILPSGYKLINGYILGPDVNLSNADLSGFDVMDIDLSHSILDGLISKNVIGNPILPTNYKIINGYIIGPNVNLTGVHFEDLDLTSCNLKGIKSGSIQGKPILPNGYHLINGFILGPFVDLTNANFIDVDLSLVDLSNSILNGLISKYIKGTPKLPDNYKLLNGHIIGPNVNLQNADLSNLNIKDLNLLGVKSGNIIGDKLILSEDYVLQKGYILGPYADLTDADLTDLDISKLDLKGVKSGNIKGNPKLPGGYKMIKGYIIGPEVNLMNVDLSGFEIIDVNLTNTDLSTCNLNKIITKGILGIPILPKDYNIRYGYIFGPGVDLSGHDLKELNLCDLNLTNTYFRQTNLDRTILYANYITFNISDQEKQKIKPYKIQNEEIIGNYYETDEMYNGFPIYKKSYNDPKYNLIIRYQNLINSENSRWQLIYEREKNDKDLKNQIENGGGFGFSEVTKNKPIYEHTEWFIYNNNQQKMWVGMNVLIQNNKSSILKGITARNIIGTPLLPKAYQLIKNGIVGPGANLKNTDLKNTDLTGVNLSLCDLTNCDLTNAVLTNVKSGGILGKPILPLNYKLVGGYILGPDVDLSGANLKDTDLNNIDLSNSKLTHIESGNIKGNIKLPDRYSLIDGFIFGNDVNLYNGNLSGIKLYNINLHNIDLSTCNLEGIKSKNITGNPILPDNYFIVKGIICGPGVDFTDADLGNCSFVGVNLENAIFKNVKSGGILGKPVLSKEYTIINGHIIGSDVDLSDAILENIDLDNVDLNNSNLNNITSKNIKGNPILPKDYKINAGFILGPNVNISNVTLSNIDLSDMNLMGANLDSSLLYNLDLSRVNLTGANFNNIASGNIIGDPILPIDYHLIHKTIIGPNINISDVNLENADLSNSILIGITSNNIIGSPLLPKNYKLIKGVIVGPSVNLKNVDLSASDLSSIDLSGCNLSDTNLIDANVTNIISGNITGNPKLSSNYRLLQGYIIGPNVILSNAVLQNHRYINDNFNYANLSGADLTNSTFENVEFKNTNLTNANLMSSVFKNIISENILGNPILPKGYHLINGYIVGPNINIHNPNLDGVDLSGYNIKELNLKIIQGEPILPDKYKLINNIIIGPELDLSTVDLSNFDLSDTDLTGCILNDKIKNIKSGNIKGKNIVLPDNYKLIKGYIIGPYVNLSKTDLSDADLNGCDLSGADLSGSNLTNANLSGVITENIIGNPILPSGYKLINATIIGSGVKLFNLDLSGIDMTSIKLINTKFVNVNLTNTILKNSDIKGVYTLNIIGEPILPDGYKMLNKHIVGPGVDLTNADLKNIDFRDIDLRDCNLTNTDFRNANLKGVISGNIIITDWEPKLPIGYKLVSGFIVGPGIHLENAMLKNINNSNDLISFKDVNLEDSVLTGANMLSVSFNGFTSKGNIIGEPILPNQYKFLKGHIFGPKINLSNNDLTNFDLTNIDLSNSDLSGCILKNANLTGVNLTNCDLKNVKSGNIIGTPVLSKGYTITNGYITGADTGYVVINDFVIGPGVNLNNAKLSGHDLSNYNLTDSNLNGADLTKTLFYNKSKKTILNGVISGNIIGSPILPDNYKLIKGYIVGPNVNLNNLYEDDFDLSNTDLTGVDMTNSNFKNLKSGNIKGEPKLPKDYHLIKGYIIGPDVDLEGKDLSHTSINNKNLSNINFTSANLNSCDFTESVLDNVKFIGADLNYSKFLNNDLSGVNFNNANLTNADFTGSRFTNITSSNVSGIPKQMPHYYSIVAGYIVGPNIKIALDNEQKKKLIKQLEKDYSLVDIFKMESFQITYGLFKDLEKELDKVKYKSLQEYMKKDESCKKNFFQKTNRNCRFENGKIVNVIPEDFKGGNKKRSKRKTHKWIISKKKLII